MTFDVEGLLDLWSTAWQPGPAAEAAFARRYTDPVTVNGTPTPVAGLVVRSIALNTALTEQRREVLQVLDTPGAVAVAFRLRGRHTGPLRTGAGVLPATGREVELRVVDVLTLTGGRISALWMVADELGALAAIGAAGLLPPDATTHAAPGAAVRGASRP